MALMVYEVTFKGVASAALRAAFDDCEVRSGRGHTTLRTPPIDRAALHGLLNRIDSLGLDVLEVRLVHEAEGGTPAGESPSDG